MQQAPEKIAFAVKVNSKFNELVDWIIENTTNKELPLHRDDFAEVQESFRKIACGVDAQQWSLSRKTAVPSISVSRPLLGRNLMCGWANHSIF